MTSKACPGCGSEERQAGEGTNEDPRMCLRCGRRWFEEAGATIERPCRNGKMRPWRKVREGTMFLPLWEKPGRP